MLNTHKKTPPAAITDPVWIDVLLTGLDTIGRCSVYDLYHHLRACGIHKHILLILMSLRQLEKQKRVRRSRRGGVTFWELNHA